MTKNILHLNPQRATDTEAGRHLEHLRALAELELKRSAPVSSEAEITVRALHESDRAAMDALAGRDSTDAPEGEVLGAEIDGRLVAMLSLTDGAMVADPFSPTAAATELLNLRARQVGAAGGRGRFPRLRRRSVPRARGALAGSPPGSGRLLRL